MRKWLVTYRTLDYRTRQVEKQDVIVLFSAQENLDAKLQTALRAQIEDKFDDPVEILDIQPGEKFTLKERWRLWKLKKKQ